MGCVDTMIKNISPAKALKGCYVVNREHFADNEEWMSRFKMCHFCTGYEMDEEFLCSSLTRYNSPDPEFCPLPFISVQTP